MYEKQENQSMIPKYFSFMATSVRIGNYYMNYISRQPGMLTRSMTEFFLNLNFQVFVDKIYP